MKDDRKFLRLSAKAMAKCLQFMDKTAYQKTLPLTIADTSTI